MSRYEGHAARGDATARYAALVLAYAVARDEACLADAGALGRELVAREVPVEEIAELHEEALRALAAHSPDVSLLVAADVASPPLVELLMAYGLADRENTEARRAGERLLAHQVSLAQLGEMAAVVAHEIRNPLAGIAGALRAIATAVPSGPPSDILGEALSRIAALNTTMDELLLFARPQRPRLGATVHLRAFALESAAFVRRDPRFSGVEIDVEGPEVELAADTRLLRPMLLNLLLNAAQAIEGRGRIVVGVERGANTCRLTVSDYGPGIPLEARGRVFEPFFTTKGAGTGLGLPTVRRAVEAHGGTVDIDCPDTGGTVVTIELPRPPGPP